MLDGLESIGIPTNLESYTGDFDFFNFGLELYPDYGDTTVFENEQLYYKLSSETRNSGIATLTDILAIKMSHLSWDIFWWKHVQDILFLRSQGVSVNEELYNALKEHWKVEHGNKDYLSLYRTKDEFFDDFVPKQWEHDYLHTLVAQNSVPVYESCLKEGHDVYIDKQKFDMLHHDQKVRMFKEEIAVIALERWVIPSKQNIPICHAWSKSLHKTVTALTKGWASEFIIENIEEFLQPLHQEMLKALCTIKEN